MNGILIINKEKDYTSRDVVNKLIKILHTNKIGHTGTLDPIATGVLVVTIGKATKLCDILTSEYKEYIATMKLGIETDTLDITGNTIKEKEYNVNVDKIKEVLNSFVGKSIQEVPKYSAIKINEKKLFEKNLNDDTAGYLRTKIASRIDIRHTPKIRFVYDNSIEYGSNIEQKIKEIHEKDSSLN